MIIAQRFSVGSSRARGTSPEGTVEPGGILSRPFGTGPFARLQPNAKALGYYHMSLRDNGLARDREFPEGIAAKAESNDTLIRMPGVCPSHEMPPSLP